ncbi:MAG TPA: M20 family metallo-hydrolase [Desulfobacterales bacterium]|nr:M20 family metallo-hydrolase [Desulfobacterales bacterium]
MKVETLRVNGKRLRESLERMAEIGATPGGGVQRLTLTDEDRRARDLFASWLREIGCAVTVDRMGNMFGRRAARHDGLPPVMSGSHIDSQPRGGRFDGILGVMGALEVLRTLHESSVVTERPVVAVNWTNEEGSRFSPAMVGSGVWAGALELDWAYSRTDAAGKRLGDELARIGYLGEAPCRAFPVHSYHEYHIEQGPVLEREGKTIGVPKGIVSLLWGDVHLTGEGNHAGTTPMNARHDALVAAAEMIVALNAVAGRAAGDMVATVGEIRNRPNSRNIIPDGVDFTVDMRAWEGERLQAAWERFCAEAGEIAWRHGCDTRLEKSWFVDRTPFDETLVRRISDAAVELGYSHMPWVSGAGHDAAYVSRLCPTAMIFVPSIGGRSHVEVESTRWEDCEAGCNVLLRCTLQSAMEP